MLRVGAFTAPIVAMAWLLACNVVRLAHQGLRRDFANAGMVERTVELDADRVHYWHHDAPAAERAPVLLLHGFGGAAVWQWAEQLPALTADRAVLVPDLLWFGGSSSTDPDPSLEHQVAAVVALLDHEGLAEVDVVGISYGGLVGYLLTRQHGPRVRRLVLVDSPGPVYTVDDQTALLARFSVENVAELIIPRDEDDVKRLLDVAYFDPPYAPRFVLRQVQAQMYAPYRGPQTALLRALQGEPRNAGTDPVDAEVGLIWGDADEVFPLAIGQRLATAWGAPLHVIPQARHAPNLEHPERFNAALLELLDGDR